MSIQVATYSFVDVKGSLVGPTGSFSVGSDSGNAEEGITITAADKNVMTIGADGSGMHNLAADKSGQVTIRLLKTSPINQLLSLAYAAQTANSSLHGKNLLTFTNPVTGDVITCRQSAFKKAPDLTYAKEGGMNEWVFDSVQIDRLLGNGSPAL